MESGKQGIISPETSSEENNEEVNGSENSQRARTRRSYECTYCKRGFTNAQALGGHMNIHRKDRAKAKQNTANSSNYFRHQTEQEGSTIPTLISTSPSPFSSHLPNWYQPTYNINHVDHQSNYYHHHNMYFHDQPSSGPSIAASFPYGYSNFEGSTTAMNHSNLTMNEELMSADLSLQIDSSRGCFDRDDDHGMEARPRGLANDELDLELRLGHR